MTRKSNRQDHSPISTTVEQVSLLSTNDTPSRGKGKQITINSTSSVQEIKQYAIAIAQHAESNIQVRPGGTIVITPPNPCRLPNEILALLFSYTTNSQSTLYACTLANKQCYALANSMLWKAPTFLDYNMNTRFLDCMVTITDQRRNTLGRLIHDLRLTHLYFMEKRVPQLLPYMPNLQHLTVIHCDADTILRRLPAPLTSLKLNKVYCTEKRVPQLLSYIPNLHHLTLAHCNADTILRRLPAPLTSLKLNRAFVTDSGFDIIAQCPLEVFDWDLQLTQLPVWLTHLGRCPLRRLSIHCRPTTRHLRNIQQRTATNISRLPTTSLASFLTNPYTFPHLTYLSISRVPDINDMVLTQFFKNHPLLEQLHLSFQFAITDATLDAMHLPRLTRASLTYLEHVTSPAVRRLINACPLTYLDIHGCKQVVPSDFPEVSVTKWGVLNSSELDKIRASV